MAFMILIVAGVVSLFVPYQFLSIALHFSLGMAGAGAALMVVFLLLAMCVHGFVAGTTCSLCLAAAVLVKFTTNSDLAALLCMFGPLSVLAAFGTVIFVAWIRNEMEIQRSRPDALP